MPSRPVRIVTERNNSMPVHIVTTGGDPIRVVTNDISDPVRIVTSYMSDPVVIVNGGTPPIPPVPPSQLATGLLHYWKLDETSGYSIDSVGTLTLSPTNAPMATVGKIGNCVDFDAASEQSLDSAVVLDWSSSFSVCFWAKIETNGDLGTYRNVLRQGHGFYGTGPEIMRPASDTMAYIYRQGYNGESAVVHATPVYLDTWSFLAFIHDAASKTIYASVNAEAQVSAAYTFTPGASTYAFKIGDSGTAHLYWDGMIDEFGIWNRAISQDEIALLYNIGNGLTYPF